MRIIISSLFRTICIFYLYRKILTNQTKLKCSHSKYLGILLVMFVITSLSRAYIPELFSVISVILFSFAPPIIYKHKIDLSLFVTAISHAIFYIANNLCSMLITLIYSPCYYFNIFIPYELLILFSGALTIMILICLFKIKRLQSGMHFITNKNILTTGILISLSVLTIKTTDNIYVNSSKHISAFILPLVTFLLAILLFTWWRRQITKSYREKLRQLEIQSLYDEIEEKDKLIQQLTDDNYSLSRIIHKDNKLIPAMENTVTDFLLHSDFSDPILIEQYGKQLADKLQTMSHDRKGILETYGRRSNELHLTGNVSIDSVLAYMQKKAEANQITMECKHNKENLQYLLEKISEEDLSHLLSDLIENALIAMNENDHGKLQIIFGRYKKEAYISVADSGRSFDIATLHDFGLAPHTTHAENGGSGIGLMDLWKLKKKYRASIQIQEYKEHKDHFTKKIIFSFNSRNHYVIQSYRHNDIMNTQTRGDLYVLPADDTEKIGGESA